jgi:hypothetical protein
MEREERRRESLGVVCRADGALLEVEGTRTEDGRERVAARLQRAADAGESATVLSILRRRDQGACRERRLCTDHAHAPNDVQLSVRRLLVEPTARSFAHTRPSRRPLAVYTRRGCCREALRLRCG